MKAKGILFLLFMIVFKVAFSQELQRIEIDENINIKIPIDYNQVEGGDTLTIVAFTTTGKLKIERINLSSNLNFSHEDVDGLKYFVDGYIKGMDFGVGLELFENSKGLLDGFQTRKIRYRVNSKEQIIETLFLVLDKQLYQFQYTENSLLLSEDTQIIFSSIRVK